MSRTWQCADCPLRDGGTHRIAAAKRAQHLLEIQAFLDAQGDKDDLGDPDPHATTTIPLADDSGQSADTLADIFTGLIITDDGPSIHGQQHSKLFSTRDDFQASLPQVPIAFQPPSPADALGRIQSVARQVRTAPATKQERRTATLMEIRERVRRARDALDIAEIIYATNSDQASARRALDVAAETVVAAGRLLNSVKPDNKDANLAKLWEEVQAEARLLDQLVDCVGAVVPSTVEMDSDVPVEYNTDHHFEDPIRDLDTVAQIMILLAVICNVVMGLATDACNFLVDTVALIIDLTMSLSIPADAGYTAEQIHVRSQLPSTLESALKTFKLEPKTRIFATCPSCHYTHDAKSGCTMWGAIT
ncbi:hypothetical protein FB45DRAFT_873871 [Roridomyces roridus]|uniref:Uncharacterized protein n=1 Tax=Roridomyces roridus TaxID=1738132 RepID=A0AAD7BAY6_9AGAR|nr:hypothetical protein FB45DRAFT_873871 [Roridomyces roridus]